MSLILDDSKTQEALVKELEGIQKERQDVLVMVGYTLEDGTPLSEFVEEETDYLCFRCYHKLVTFKRRSHSFGPTLYYCSNDDCMAGSFYEPEAKEMTRRIYRDV